MYKFSIAAATAASGVSGGKGRQQLTGGVREVWPDIGADARLNL